MKMLLQFIFIILISLTKNTTSAAAANPKNNDLIVDGEDKTRMAGPETLDEASPFHLRIPTRKLQGLVCQAKGSPGTHLCGKKCVNLNNDLSNCGSCKRKCKALQICCKSKCVNYLTDPFNCGGCHKICKKGHKCVYGICNYA